MAPKRKIETVETKGKTTKKKKKHSSQSLTVDELNNFRETQYLFNSSPFRSQLDELLKSEIVKENTRNKLNKWIEDIKRFLLHIDFSFSVETPSKDPIAVPEVLLPLGNKVKPVKVSFTFVKPKAVEVFGSYASDCLMKDSGNIDLVVEIPEEVFQKEDYLNEKYLRKRNIYLSCLASKLLSAADDALIDGDLNYIVTNNIDKPILRLKHPDTKLRKYSIFIHVIPEKDIFPSSRFVPTLNNVRYGWYFDTTGDGKLNSATPFYNSVIRHDLVARANEELRRSVFSTNPKFRDAFILLKVWLRQRNLDEGLGSFTGFMMAMFMVYLHQKKMLNSRMNALEILRIVWLAFDQTNWHMDGISLNESESLELYKSNYEVVFVDVTGTANVASVLSLSTYLRVKSEAQLAVRCLNDPTTYNFQALFMKRVQILYEFDHVICFSKMGVLRRTVKRCANMQLQLDLRSDIHSQFLKVVLSLLERAVGRRVSLMFSVVEPLNLVWSVNEKMPRHANVLIGFTLDPEQAFNIITKGPTANLPEATEFRQFWGLKSELRRFKDGDVCEATCWAKGNDPLQKKRLIVRDIVRYMFEHRLQILPEEYVYIADQMESIVFDSFNERYSSCGTGEEACLGVIDSFLDLSKTLRQLNDMPLEITSTQGTSAVFRYSALYPTLPNVQVGMKKSLASDEKSLFFKDDSTLQHTPLYVAPIDAVLQLSANNKWPTDLRAIRALQAAYYIKLSTILQNDHKFVCRPHRSYVDILKDGYVFRLRIGNSHEISAVKRQIEDSGEVKYCDNAESKHLERTLIQLPTLTSALHGLHLQNSAFGAACVLCKRWIRSQLIDEFYFPDICVDLLVAYLCLNSAPYVVPHQPQTIFVRFLKFLSSPDWFVDPIVVNFNDEISREEVLDIEVRFCENRDSFPALLLITPFDKSGSTWTTEQPSPMILKRLSNLASASLQVVDLCLNAPNSCSGLKEIFRPPLKGYDILVRAFATVNSCRWLALDVDTNMDALVPIKNTPRYEKLPILDFHPVRWYVESLRVHFGEHCLFFYDSCGGNCVGVLLKPEAKSTYEFKIANMKGMVKKDNKLTSSVALLMEDFRNVGKHIVSSVEECKK